MLDALDLQRCHNPQRTGIGRKSAERWQQPAPAAGSRQSTNPQGAPARPFRSAERARIGTASPHTDTPP